MPELEHWARRLLCYPLCLAVLSAGAAGSAPGGQRAAEPGGASLQIVCAPERPLGYWDESTTLRAWVVDAAGNAVVESLQFTWNADTGTVAGGDV